MRYQDRNRCRNLHLAHIRMWAGDYTLSGLVGFELRCKTVGVFGTGAIGSAAARIFCVSAAGPAHANMLCSTSVVPSQLIAYLSACPGNSPCQDVQALLSLQPNPLLQAVAAVSYHLEAVPCLKYGVICDQSGSTNRAQGNPGGSALDGERFPCA